MRDIIEMKRARAKIIEEARGITEKAKAEKRELTDDERAKVDELLADAEKRAKDIEQEERLQAVESGLERTDAVHKPDPEDKRDVPGQSEKRFASLGEQLRAVMEACREGGRIDPRLQTRAASGLSEGIPSDGGFLVQTDFAQELLKRTYETGILANRCRRIPISSGANSLKINGIDESSRADGSRWGGVRAYWEAEADTATASKPKFRQINLNLSKLMGVCYATDELLADAAALESVIMQAFAEEFGFKLDDAIVRGSGAGQPLGILNCGALVTVSKESGQSAATILYENILKMWARLWARSRPNAVWYINQDIEPQLYTMSLTVGTGGAPVYLPAGGASSAPYATLFGRPVIPIEQCSTLGTVGDIILADLSQYLLVDKGAMQTASSIHVRFLYGENTFRFIYRVDGQPIWNSALTPYKGSNTLSPFVALATRS